MLGEFGIYVHVPFCVHRCSYCDFNAYAGLLDQAPAYMSALVRDAREALSAPEAIAPRPRVTSVFFGGGTPSLVEAASLVAVLDAIRDAWSVEPDAEITVECNPESVTSDKLEAWFAAGVNRLSIGVQSLDDNLLASLERTHDADAARRAIVAAQRAGFENLNADLIFGIPGETDETWEASLRGLIDLGVPHMSCYALTYEEGTPLHAWRRLGKIEPVPDDDVAVRWETADDVLGRAGLQRYEISNWSAPGRECRHNLTYWTCGEYLGIGAGAHSHLGTRDGSARSWTVKAPAGYAKAIGEGRRPVAGLEAVGRGGRAAEVMFLGLRRTSGVSHDQFRSLTGLALEEVYGAQITRLTDRGLIVGDGGGIRLTRRGTLLANEVVTAFLVDDEDTGR